MYIQHRACIYVLINYNLHSALSKTNIKMFMFFTHGRSKNLITPGAVMAVIVW